MNGEERGLPAFPPLVLRPPCVPPASPSCPLDNPPSPLAPPDRLTMLHRPVGENEPRAIDLGTERGREIRRRAQRAIGTGKEDTASFRAIGGDDPLGDAGEDGIERDVLDEGGVELRQQRGAAPLPSASSVRARNRATSWAVTMATPR